MGIFQTIPIAQGDQTIRAALAAIVNRANVKHLPPAAWSLAELGLNDADVHWLQGWARRVDEATVGRWLLPGANNHLSMPGRAAIGALLMLLATEQTRRVMPRESRWAVALSVSFNEQTRKLLYADGQPTEAHLDSLAQASRRLHLRQNDGWETPESECENIVLQIAMTEADLHQRLPRWLRNDGPPKHLLHLLDSASGSRSFQQFWSDCRGFQQGDLSEPELRAALAASPWILPQWADQIAKALEAHRPPTIQTASAAVQPETEFTTGFQMEDLFSEFTPYGGVKTIIRAVRAIFVRADGLRIRQKAWSLAELRLSDYDYLWLRVWVKRLELFTVWFCVETRQRFKAGNESVSFRAGLGCLLMLWIAETARRRAAEGELWPYVEPDHFELSVAAELFRRNQPSGSLREMLACAARELKLRHAFDDDGAQCWLDTVFLQFGFTRQGFKSRLAEWLAGQAATRSVRELLDAENGSDSFQRLWESLRDFRQNSITEKRLHETLTGSPWVLPEWNDELIAAALEKRGLGQIASIVATSDKFLTEPKLIWDSQSEPRFVCQLAPNLEPLNLKEDRYDLFVAGERRLRLLSQADGSYLAEPTCEVSIRFGSPRVAASLIGRSGEVAASCELELWPEDEDEYVTVFKLSSGKRLKSGEAMNTQASYALLLASDLAIEPQPSQWRIGPNQNAKLYLLPAGRWSAQTQVLLGNDPVWQARTTAQTKPPVPIWARPPQVVLWHPTTAVTFGNQFEIEIRHPADVAVRFVRCERRPMDFLLQDSISTKTHPITLDPANHSSKIKLQVGLQNGSERCRINSDVEISPLGAARLTADGWQVLNGREVMTVEQAKTSLFKIKPPRRFDGNGNPVQWVLMEGDEEVKRLRSRDEPLGSLNGFGAPLGLRHGPYNNPDDEFRLAASVVDRGLIEAAICESLGNGTAKLLRLKLSYRLEPSEKHSVVWWDENGEVKSLTPDYCDEAEDAWWWVCQLPDDAGRFIAVALAYDGARLGAWWEWNWASLLLPVAHREPLQTAALLRWFRLPVLNRDVVDAIRGVSHKHAAAFIDAWLKGTGLPNGLRLEDAGNKWHNVVRAIFRWWRTDTEAAEQLLPVIAGTQTVATALKNLPHEEIQVWRISPLLFGSILKAWIELLPAKQRAGAQDQVKNLRMLMAGCNNETNYDDWLDEMISKAAVAIDGDTYFIRNVILGCSSQWLFGQKISPRDQSDLMLAEQVESLRVLIALYLLEQIQK